MKAITTGRKFIGGSLCVILMAWALCIWLPMAIPAGSDDLGLGLIVVLAFIGMHSLGLLLDIVGTVFMIHAVANDKDARTLPNTVALFLGTATFVGVGWYVWVLTH